MNAEGLRQERHALPVAAIVDRSGVKGEVDALLTRTASLLQRNGRVVHGLLMTYPQVAAGCSGQMVLVDIRTLDEYLVSQPLGSGARGCRADPQGFATASRVLRDALTARPDLVISNRFGGLEVEGGGFADELLALMAEGVPLLTAVAERHLDAWRRFSDGATELPAQPETIQAWLDQTLARPAKT